MPRHDFSLPPRRGWDARIQFLKRWRPGKGKPGKETDDGGVPADPRKPKDLSGGAAAALDFEDE